ncbi:replication initiator protein A [Novipirellula rosea]|uniref:Replication initiator protein A n=1 Tax=Novipirellula rosea TaxID=1031540 RepID=A0ABP8NQD8_9BACT
MASDSYELSATGVDEMNFAEFPLAAISKRIDDGKKTVTFENVIFDRKERRNVVRRLTLSGSDRYGLPIVSDEDVLLGCIQLTRLQGYRSSEVQFSRYELLKLLAWPDNTRNYQRLAQSLRRWKGLTIFSDRAFYDHAAQSWVNRDFSVFDNLQIYHRESQTGSTSSGQSRFTWNEVIFNSFQAGYLKKLDWNLYLSLSSPIAKRLYRFLDKRFYYGNHVEIDLHELAVMKMRLSENYNAAQIKRVLLKGIAELESKWELKSLPGKVQFEKVATSRWIVRFQRKPKRKSIDHPIATGNTILDRFDQSSLAVELTRRGIGPASASELVENAASTNVQTMIEMFDWYNNHGQPRGPGFLVQAIRNPNSIVFPRGFESSEQAAQRRTAQTSRVTRKRILLDASNAEQQQTVDRLQTQFQVFWDGLSPAEQIEFEDKAIELADSTKRLGYYRYQGREGKLFQQYRNIVLRDHYTQLVAVKAIVPSK